MTSSPKTLELDRKARKKFGQAAITNGVVELDARSKIARRFRDICSAIYADQGGETNCSEVRLQLTRRFSAACCLAEEMEAKMAVGEKIPIDDHAALSSTLVRIAHRIGVDRRSRVINTPTLRDYLDDQTSDDETATVIEDEEAANET